MTAIIASARFNVSDQDLRQDQDQQQPEQHQFNSFKGLYIGSALIDHLNLVDPNQEIWYHIADYINSFPYSQSFFETVFPFYMGSHVTENELTAFYQTDFCDCVGFFQMNHPDWNEYSQSECLQHFKDAIEHYADESGDYSTLVYRMYQTTPPTLEKPHFSVYQERYVEETNELGKSYYQWNCCYNPNDKAWSGNDTGKVTHWMPLPEPPLVNEQYKRKNKNQECKGYSYKSAGQITP